MKMYLLDYVLLYKYRDEMLSAMQQVDEGTGLDAIYD